MSFKSIAIVALLTMTVSLAACSALSGSTARDVSEIETTPTRVVVRILDLSGAGPVIPSEVPTAEQPTSTPVILPTPTPVPIQATDPNQTQVPAPERCLNQAEFIRSLSIADNTVLNERQPFTKIWQIKNTGSCTWTTEYLLLFFSGDSMGGPTKVNFPEIVPPGATVNIKIKLTAPIGAATFTGNWVLSDPNGNLFGIGQDGSKPLSVVIQVKPTPRPTPG